MTNIMKCSRCGWYHFALSKEEIDRNNASFSAYIDSLSQSDLDQHYGGVAPSISTYEQCFGCRTSYMNMVEDDGKCPNGVTIQGIRKPS